MNREERAGSTDSVVTDDSEDPLTCPLTQRLFHDPVILVASGVTYEASALEECLRRAPDMDPKTGERFELPAVTAPHLTHRGASWASGAAQAAHVVRIILRWFGVCEARAGGVVDANCLNCKTGFTGIGSEMRGTRIQVSTTQPSASRAPGATSATR